MFTKNNEKSCLISSGGYKFRHPLQSPGRPARKEIGSTKIKTKTNLQTQTKI